MIDKIIEGSNEDFQEIARGIALEIEELDLWHKLDAKEKISVLVEETEGGSFGLSCGVEQSMEGEMRRLRVSGMIDYAFAPDIKGQMHPVADVPFSGTLLVHDQGVDGRLRLFNSWGKNPD